MEIDSVLPGGICGRGSVRHLLPGPPIHVPWGGSLTPMSTPRWGLEPVVPGNCPKGATNRMHGALNSDGKISPFSLLTDMSSTFSYRCQQPAGVAGQGL